MKHLELKSLDLTMSDTLSAAQVPAAGLITDDPGGVLLGLRLAAAGHRVLFYHLTTPSLPSLAQPDLAPPAPTLPGLAQSRLGANIEAAATLADIAIECSVIVLAIDDTTRVRQILFGSPGRAGLIHDMAPGTLVIDTGVRLVRESQALLGILGTRGISLVDAALIGAPEALARGTLTVFTGGFPDAVNEAEPLLSSFGRVERTGPLGSAQTAAALMGYVEAAHVSARSEALAVGSALGLSPEVLTRVLQDAPDTANVVRLTRRADIMRALAKEKGLTAEILAFERRNAPNGATENR